MLNSQKDGIWSIKKNTSSSWFPVHLCDWCWCQRSFIWISIILLALSPRHHISCCLLWSMTSDESDKVSAPLHGNASCAGLSPRSDGMSPSANLSLEIQLGSCDTRSNSNRDITALWKRGVSYWMTPPQSTQYIAREGWGDRTKMVIGRNTLSDVECVPDWNQLFLLLL